MAARGSTPKRTPSGEEKKRNAALRLPLAARYAEGDGDRERERARERVANGSE